MINLDTKKEYLLHMPTNVNGLVNAVLYYLQRNGMEDATAEQVKDFFRVMRVMDFHIFGTAKMSLNREFWTVILSRVMNVYMSYFRDAMTYFGCDFLVYNRFTDDIGKTVGKMLGSTVNVKCPYFNRNARYDHDYVMEYVCMGKPNGEPWHIPMFNLRHAVMTDEIDTFVPRIYGGKQLTPFTAVYNRANVPFIMDEKVRTCLGRIKNDMNGEYRVFLHDLMWNYFDEHCIDSLTRYVKDHVKVLAPRWYNDSINNNVNIVNKEYVKKLYHYTNVEPLDNLDCCKDYFREFIESCYRCR